MDLATVLKTKPENRDFDWEERFFKAVTEAKLHVLAAEPQTGPDGWPYLLTSNAEGATDSAQQILHWLSDKGIGLVVNPEQEYPDYVFNWGMIWHFKETGRFVLPQDQMAPLDGKVEIQDKSKMIAGPPTEKYLPKYVRQILKDFFRDQGLLQVKIAVLSQDGKHYDLGFSLESLGNPPENEHQGIAEAISWFLPPHYSILLISERNLPFQPL